MSTDNTSPSPLQQLADEQEQIRASYRFVFELPGSPPGSKIPWPSDRLSYALAELRARMEEPVQPDPENPYVQYDTFLAAHCGPDGFVRVGDTVGIRDQGAAKALLRWIYPTLVEQEEVLSSDMKRHLARMITKVQPHRNYVEKILSTIGEDVVSRLTATQLALLIDRIFILWREIEEETRSEMIFEGTE